MNSRPLPAKHADVFHTRRMSTPYLKEPGVVLLGVTEFDLDGVKPFLDGFDEELGYGKYLQDPPVPTPEALLKFAGQLCYMSFGPKRTWNQHTSRYFQHIKQSGHGSVLEHINLSFLFYGISRSLTHELVRHRAGMGFSQLSQRYVDGKALRFVERPEYQNDAYLHNEFEDRIDCAAGEYNSIAASLLRRQQENKPDLTAEKATDLRKKVNQAARSVLPNETEAPIVTTMNGRALRHTLEMRASEFAEVEIRKLFNRVYEVAKTAVPYLLEDYQCKSLPDGTFAVETEYRKV